MHSNGGSPNSLRRATLGNVVSPGGIDGEALREGGEREGVASSELRHRLTLLFEKPPLYLQMAKTIKKNESQGVQLWTLPESARRKRR
jgi:hypothetical protein